MMHIILASALDNLFGNGISQLIGDNMWLGILTLIWFGVFTMLQGLRLDAKLAILVPAAILSMVFLPMLTLLGAVIMGVVLYMAVMKLINR